MRMRHKQRWWPITHSTIVWRDTSFDSDCQFGDEVAPFNLDSSADDITRTLGVSSRDYAQLEYPFPFTGNIGVTLEATDLIEEHPSQYFQYENLPFALESGSRGILPGVRGMSGNGAR